MRFNQSSLYVQESIESILTQNVRCLFFPGGLIFLFAKFLPEICDQLLRYFSDKIPSQVRPDTGPDIFQNSGDLFLMWISVSIISTLWESDIDMKKKCVETRPYLSLAIKKFGTFWELCSFDFRMKQDASWLAKYFPPQTAVSTT